MSEEKEFRPAGEGWVRDQLATIDASGDTRSVQIMGRPIVVVEILGARSGLWRKVPLMRVEHEGTYAAVGSRGGAPKDPAWCHSITVNPDVQVQDGTQSHALRARRLTGGEREQWWARCVAAYPPYADYQNKTEREIPVFALEPR